MLALRLLEVRESYARTGFEWDSMEKEGTMEVGVARGIRLGTSDHPPAGTCQRHPRLRPCTHYRGYPWWNTRRRPHTTGRVGRG